MDSSFIQCYSLSWYEMSFCHLVPEYSRKGFRNSWGEEDNFPWQHIQEILTIITLTKVLHDAFIKSTMVTLESLDPLKSRHMEVSVASKWPWISLELLHGCSYSKHDASCYIQLISLFFLLHLCSETWAGFPTLLQCYQQWLEQLHLSLQLFVLRYIPGSICFKCWRLCLKMNPR